MYRGERDYFKADALDSCIHYSAKMPHTQIAPLNEDKLEANFSTYSPLISDVDSRTNAYLHTWRQCLSDHKFEKSWQDSEYQEYGESSFPSDYTPQISLSYWNFNESLTNQSAPSLSYSSLSSATVTPLCSVPEEKPNPSAHTPPPLAPAKSIYDITRYMLRSSKTPFRVISNQKYRVVKIAFGSNPHPTLDQISFLASCLQIDYHGLKQWSETLPPDPAKAKPTSRKRAKKCLVGTIAPWKCKVIKHGFDQAPNPTYDQVHFLAIGLQISAEEIWRSGCGHARSSSTSNFRECRKHLHSPTPQLSREQSLVPLRGPIDLNGRISETSIESHRVPVLKSPTIMQSTLYTNIPNSTPCASGGIMLRELAQASYALPQDKSADEQRRTLDEIYGENKLADSTPKSHNTPTMLCSHNSESDINQEADDEDDHSEAMSVEDEIAAIFGRDQALSVLRVINTLMPEGSLHLLQSDEGFRQYQSGNRENPALSSTQMSGAGSSTATPSSGPTGSGTGTSPNTTSSDSSSGSKRKRPTGDDPDEQENNGNGDDYRSLKRAKPIRWDCPLCRRPIGVPGNNPGCAREGLEFRHLWYVSTPTIPRCC